MIDDPIFGRMTYNAGIGWEGSYTYPFLEHEVTVRLDVDGKRDQPIDLIERDAMRQFNLRKRELCVQADDALYAYYLELLPDLRDQFGDSADALMPIVDDKDGLAGLITPTSFYVRRPRLTDDRVIGLLYDCTWDTSLGLAVKFVNETVEEVGPQDIVL